MVAEVKSTLKIPSGASLYEIIHGRELAERFSISCVDSATRLQFVENVKFTVSLCATWSVLLRYYLLCVFTVGIYWAYAKGSAAWGIATNSSPFAAYLAAQFAQSATGAISERRNDFGGEVGSTQGSPADLGHGEEENLADYAQQLLGAGAAQGLQLPSGALSSRTGLQPVGGLGTISPIYPSPAGSTSQSVAATALPGSAAGTMDHSLQLAVAQSALKDARSARAKFEEKSEEAGDAESNCRSACQCYREILDKLYLGLGSAWRGMSRRLSRGLMPLSIDDVLGSHGISTDDISRLVPAEKNPLFYKGPLALLLYVFDENADTVGELWKLAAAEVGEKLRSADELLRKQSDVPALQISDRAREACNRWTQDLVRRCLRSIFENREIRPSPDDLPVLAGSTAREEEFFREFSVAYPRMLETCDMPNFRYLLCHHIPLSAYTCYWVHLQMTLGKSKEATLPRKDLLTDLAYFRQRATDAEARWKSAERERDTAKENAETKERIARDEYDKFLCLRAAG